MDHAAASVCIVMTRVSCQNSLDPNLDTRTLLKSLVSKLGSKFVEFEKLTKCDRVVPCTAIAVNKRHSQPSLCVCLFTGVARL